MKLLNIFKRKQAKPINDNLMHCYTDKEGVKYYTYKNITDLPAIRLVNIEKETRFVEMYMTEDVLRIALKMMKEAGNKQDWVQVFSIIQDLEIRLKFLSEEKTLLKLAALYFFEEGENPYKIDDNILDNKQARWDNDEEAKTFFLTFALRLTKRRFNLSEDDLLNYMKENEANVEMLNSKLWQKQ